MQRLSLSLTRAAALGFAAVTDKGTVARSDSELMSVYMSHTGAGCRIPGLPPLCLRIMVSTATVSQRGTAMAKVVCVLYEDPVTGYPKTYARDAIPDIVSYPG